MRPGTGFLIGMKRLGILVIISLLFASLIPLPSVAGSQLTGPYGTPQLQLISASITNQTQYYYDATTGVIYGYTEYAVQGRVYIGGEYYYVNSSVAKATQAASASNSSTAYGSGSGTNSSATATSSASASASSSSNTTVLVANQNEVPAPITLYGYSTLYYPKGTKTYPLSFSGGKTYTFHFPNGSVVKSSQLFFVGNTSSFSTEGVINQPLYATIYIEMTNPINNETIGQPLQAAVSGNSSAWLFIDLYNTVVALPQFNDTMLGAWATRPSDAQPALPLAPYYNLMAIVGIIALVPLALADVLTPDKGGLGGALVKIAIGVLIILLFPFIYDHIAYMMNILNQMIIAYPQPYQYYSVMLAQLEGYMVFPASLNILSVLATGALFVGYLVVTVILWIMNFILGTVRILLIAGMIILFPLSLSLRDFRYTQKLGRIIEDTLMGLMLATILSASMLGIADYLLNNWSSVDNMFRLAGIQSQWVAISAVLGALLAPTVLAPLVSTMYMASTQVASVAGGVASALWLGVAGGGIHGAMQAGGGGLDKLVGGAGGALLGLGSTAISLPRIVTSLHMSPSPFMRHESMLVGTLRDAIMRSQ